MKFRKLLLFCSFLTISLGAFAQNEIVVTGAVYDDSNMPVPGATVLVKGTNNAVSTDIDGAYKIKTEAQATLVFSFIGYASNEEPIKGRSLINTKLFADTQNLNEVVVVGYGTQKKSVVTGAISSVKAKDLENLPLTRVEQSLQGRVSGVMVTSNSGQPGSSSTIRIRGQASFGNNDPLWVVDGTIVDANGIGFLNQSDIASMEVLKDAASQAIYGTRASAGVILITTKKGSGGLKITYNGYSGNSKAARKLDLLDATQYATLRNESSVAAGNPLIFDNVASLGSGTDWQSLIFNNNAHRTSHEISASGSTDKSNFYLSFGYLDQEGIVSTSISKYMRKNIRINSNYEIRSWLKIGQTLGFSNEKNSGLGNTNSEYGGPLSSAINLDPTTPAIVTDPTEAGQAIYANNPVVRDDFGNPFGISRFVGQELTNPLAYAQTRRGNFGWSDNFVGNVYAEIQFAKGLKFRSNVAGKLSYWGTDYFNPVAYLNASTITSTNSLTKQQNKGFGWSVENTLAYERSIANHNFTVLIGQGSYIDNISSGTSVTYSNLPVDNFYDAAFIGGTPASDRIGSAYAGVEHRVSSLFARLNYDYKEKYLLTGIVRRDGSTRFGANNHYGVFPSFSLGWVVSKEGFWKENNAVNSLKIRGGYGVVGSDAVGEFAFISSVGPGRSYSIGTSPSNIVSGYSPDRPSNPDLKWEETKQVNVGLEMQFLTNFNMVLDYYQKKTDNLLRTQPIPAYIGVIAPPYRNIGAIDNSGFEIELAYKKQFGDFGFGLSGNATYLQNEVKYLNPGTDFFEEDRFQGVGNTTRVQPGHAYHEFFGYETLGIFQTQAEVDAYRNSNGDLIQPNAAPGDFKFEDNNGDGRISEDDRAYIGNPTPDWTFGATLNLNYKGFDLLAFGQGVAGNQIFQGLRRLDVAGANYQTEALNRWTGPGTSNEYPRLVDGDPNGNFSKMSKFYLQDGDYFRIKVIQLGYTLPKDVTMKAGISIARLYVTGENLFTFTKYTGYDPEIGGGTLSIDRGQYPQAKSYMLGVNLQF